MKKYFYLLKRMFKKPGMALILVLLIFIIAGFKNLSLNSGQLFTIGLVLEEGADSEAQRFYNSLLQKENNFKFVFFDVMEDAEGELKNQNIDEIWYIPKNLRQSITELIHKKDVQQKIKITVQENNVFHMLLREVMFSRLMEVLSPVLSELYIEEKFSGRTGGTEPSAFLEEFNKNIPVVELFKLSAGGDGGAYDQKKGIVFLPLRGMLAIWIMVCAFAVSFCFIRDEEEGVFALWIVKHKGVRNFFYYITSLILPCVLIFITIYACGIGTSVLQEIISMFLFLISVTVFVNVLRLLSKNARNLGIILPLVILACVFFSPVFIEFNKTQIISSLLPLFYYLKGINQTEYLLYEVIYIALGFLVWSFLGFLKTRGYGHKRM